MTHNATTIATQVRRYCGRIGTDSLLVQGAGGNVSWKDGALLWIKASGTWLADAESKEIFVPVDLEHLRLAIANRNFSITPKVLGPSALKASIETLLHALLPQRIVVHLHAIEVLSYLVRDVPLENIRDVVSDLAQTAAIDYFKPGANLAQAVEQELQSVPDANVIFLKSHGVVIGGDDIESIERTLARIISRLQTKPRPYLPNPIAAEPYPLLTANGYKLCDDSAIHQLVTNDHLLQQLQTAWALYPDHVVFLGAQPSIAGINFSVESLDTRSKKPTFVFMPGQGVFESSEVTASHRVQLRCYYDVVVRQAPAEQLCTLTDVQIAELLDWDAEKYRQQLVTSQAKKT